MKRIFPIVMAIVCASLFCKISHAQTDTQETKEQRDARMKWWREARFGMFIHWGIYSVPGGIYKGEKIQHIGEWIMNDAKIPVAEYAEYATQFNPVKFDADAWVKTAKDAGMKYMVITSKHHDGFAMFHSFDPYNIYDATPFKRDPLKELSEACAKQGMKLGFYYSQAQDWHHPGGAAARKPPFDKIIDDQNHWDKAQEGSFDDYLDKTAVPQVKEILSNYGPVAVLWWDTPVNMNKERAEKFLPILKLQPNIITNNRLVRDVPEIPGDTETPEQYIPATGFPGEDWETCMTMNDTWGYKSWDDNWKSTQLLLTNLIDIASKGGNYLLNVGPSPLGKIPQPSIDRLVAIGKWMQTNGDAVYASSASPFRKTTFDGRVTVKGNQMFLFVFKWPSDGINVVGLKSPVKAAKFLAGGDATVNQTADAINVKPPANPDPIATVVQLDFDSAPQVDNTISAIHADDQGNFVLNAADVILNGRKVKLEPTTQPDHIGSWTAAADSVMWDMASTSPGSYSVEMTYSCDDANAGSEISVKVGGSKLGKQIASTGGDYKTEQIGSVTLGSGLQTLIVQPTKVGKGNAMNLKQIRLTPVK